MAHDFTCRDAAIYPELGAQPTWRPTFGRQYQESRARHSRVIGMVAMGSKSNRQDAGRPPQEAGEVGGGRSTTSERAHCGRSRVAAEAKKRPGETSAHHLLLGGGIAGDL